MALETKDNRRFINVLGSAGDFRETVTEGTPGAKLRTYESSDGKKGSKHEIAYKAVGGVITGIEFFEGDYGKNLILDLNMGEETVAVSVSTSTPYGESLLKMLPNIDMNKEVMLMPYNFTSDEGKNIRGISVKQDGEKVQNAFYNYETKESLLGYPEVEDDTSGYDSDDWKAFFVKCRKHTIAYAEKNIIPQFEGGKVEGEEL